MADAPDGWKAVKVGNDYFYWPASLPPPKSSSSADTHISRGEGYEKFRTPASWYDEDGFTDDGIAQYNKISKPLQRGGAKRAPAAKDAYDTTAAKWDPNKYPKREADGTPDYSSLDNNSIPNRPDIHLDGEYPKDPPKIDSPNWPGVYSGMFQEMYGALKPVPDHPGAGAGDGWRELGIALRQMHDWLNQVATQGYGKPALKDWVGQARDAAMGNLLGSLRDLATMATAAEKMGSVVDGWNDTIKAVRESIVHPGGQDGMALLQQNIDHYTALNDAKGVQTAKNDYDSRAYETMQNNIYKPNFDKIVTGFPKMVVYGSATPPGSIAPPPDKPGSTDTSTPKTSVPTGGGPSTPDTKKLLEQLNKLDPSKQTAEPQQQNPASNDPTKGITDAAKTATDAAKGATDAAKDAASKGMDAASQALQSLLGQNGLPGVPEGVLGLGPTGLGGSGTGRPSGARVGGGGGGTGGVGAGARELSTRQGGPTVEASKTSAAQAAQASRAGASSAAGSQGGMGPAAGSRGGGAEGKEHKANKALRTQRTGEEVVGENSEAVVPVLGAQPEKSTEKSKSQA